VTVKAYINEPDSITVGVVDNGIGIRPEDQARLFEAFYRVPYREGEPVRPRGTGLGLALVRAIVEAHNGTVRVESNYGKGSQFYMTIPVKKTDTI
jgi:two-component system, OmpR family, phosphate regulon sensor histidine kinase PhoR